MKWVSLVALFLVHASDAWPATAVPRAAAIEVHVHRAQISRQTFDPQSPPAKMPKLTPPEAGVCEYEFACNMESQIEGREALGKPFTARITSTEVTTDLKITLLTPENGPPKILAHEEAHREICELYYRPAAALARQLAARAIAPSITVTEKDRKAGMKAALTRIQNAFNAAFMRETADRCRFAQDRFDTITNHSRNPIAESEAIAQAVAEEAENYQRTKNKNRGNAGS